MSSRIGIMGGTFDPIHYGHLVISEHVRSEYKLDKIIFVPAGMPPHKKQFTISKSIHRYFMTVLATIHNPNFTVSDVEVGSDSITYTVNTIQKLKELYGQDTEFYFITGADALLDIESWKEAERLLNICHFIAGTRPGHENEVLENKIDLLKEKYNADIQLIQVPALAISSTDIRNRVKNGQSIKYLVPEAIEQYIFKNGLYK